MIATIVYPSVLQHSCSQTYNPRYEDHFELHAFNYVILRSFSVIFIGLCRHWYATLIFLSSCSRLVKWQIKLRCQTVIGWLIKYPSVTRVISEWPICVFGICVIDIWVTASVTVAQREETLSWTTDRDDNSLITWDIDWVIAGITKNVVFPEKLETAFVWYRETAIFIPFKGGPTRGDMMQEHVAAKCSGDKIALSTHWRDMLQG